MDHRKIQKLRSEVDQLRGHGGIKGTELERLARRIGRKPANRGKEPNWVNPSLPNSRPISIPGHAGDLNRFTAGSILDDLEADLDRFEELLPKPDGSIN